MLARHDEFGIADRPECPFHERNPVVAEKQLIVDEHARGAEAAPPDEFRCIGVHRGRGSVHPAAASEAGGLQASLSRTLQKNS